MAGQVGEKRMWVPTALLFHHSLWLLAQDILILEGQTSTLVA